ncbi:calcium-activated chloride channel-domain-containing protein [Baffinella frigidus]|nr:calcium-activated chloride channel-domain-containing protein [Cryptophyta sp. CCMP2293]
MSPEPYTLTPKILHPQPCIGAVVAAVCGIALIKFRIIQHLEPYGLSMVGKMCGGLMQATSIMIFNRIYQVVLKLLTDFENWQTETQYEDARIAKDFCFKLVNAFFACFFVAFVQNNFEVYGVNMHCPEWHCMQELTGTLASVFAIQMTVAQVLEVGLPIFKNRMRIRQEEMTIRKQMEEDGGDLNAIMPELSEEEAQSKMDAYEGVFAEYQEMVVQFGYVTLFAAAFPLTAFLALINNLVEIRTDAYKLLQGLQRPKYLCAADIGTWQVILDILSTCSILTNCALVGFTSHGLFFYFPNMNPVERASPEPYVQSN